MKKISEIRDPCFIRRSIVTTAHSVDSILTCYAPKFECVCGILIRIRRLGCFYAVYQVKCALLLVMACDKVLQYNRRSLQRPRVTDLFKEGTTSTGDKDISVSSHSHLGQDCAKLDMSATMMAWPVSSPDKSSLGATEEAIDRSPS